MAEPSSIVERIIEAIKTRHRVGYILAKGDVRIVEPHAFGVDYDEQDILWSWRVSAMGEVSNELQDWDLCPIDKMRDAYLLSETFEGSRPGYRRENSHMRQVYAQL